jgi:hypothetical protein
MKRLSSIIVTAALGAVAFGTVLAGTARASCVSLDENGGAIWRLQPASGQFRAFRPVLAKFALDGSSPDASIVGFWRVDFTADGADKPFDSALVQWHSDGTEIMNSSRDPRTQSFCLGVWKKTGALSFTLKHLAMSWDGVGNPVGPATILENVTLDHHGDTFTGTFVITQYEMDGTTVVPPTPITGTLSGTRITAN